MGVDSVEAGMYDSPGKVCPADGIGGPLAGSVAEGEGVGMTLLLRPPGKFVAVGVGEGSADGGRRGGRAGGRGVTLADGGDAGSILVRGGRGGGRWIEDCGN